MFTDTEILTELVRRFPSQRKQHLFMLALECNFLVRKGEIPNYNRIYKATVEDNRPFNIEIITRAIRELDDDVNLPYYGEEASSDFQRIQVTKKLWPPARENAFYCLHEIYDYLLYPELVVTDNRFQYKDGLVIKLAQTMYDSFDFSTMPILSDALSEAGCVNEFVLQHCYKQQPHYRGCWLIDLLLNLS